MSAPTDAPAEWVAIDSLVPWPRNPKIHDAANVRSIMDSIRAFGFARPLVARRETRELIAGHGSFAAARELGLTHVPVRFMDLSERQAHLLALADNRLAEKSPWDERELGAILSDYALDEAALAGWTSEDLEAMGRALAGGGVGGGEGPDGLGELGDDEIPEPPKVAITKLGDVWELGRHRLVCGDCRDAGVVGRVMASARATVAFTSPPYASQRDYDESSGFQPIRPDDFGVWFDAVQANVRGLLAADGSFFVNLKEHAEDGARHLYVRDLVLRLVRTHGWKFVDEFAWVREGVPGRWPNRFKNGWEPVFHFSQAGEIKFRPERVGHASDRVFSYDADNPKSTTGLVSPTDGMMAEGVALPSNVLKIASDKSQAKVHPAAFPVALPTFFMRAFADPGDVVFDPFLGSGTTLVAAEKTERSAVGVELSPSYCDVIVERFESVSGLKARRREG